MWYIYVEGVFWSVQCPVLRSEDSVAVDSPGKWKLPFVVIFDMATFVTLTARLVLVEPQLDRHF